MGNAARRVNRDPRSHAPRGNAPPTLRVDSIRGVWRSRAIGAREGRAWAEANNAPYFHDPAALNEHVDAYMILAPSNPELHPALCKKVFPFGKPTIDRAETLLIRRILDAAAEATDVMLDL